MKANQILIGIFLYAGYLALAASLLADGIINVDFGVGTNSAKVGFAATGNSASDFWNLYSRDDGQGGFRSFGSVTNLKWATGSDSAAGLTVANADGAWPAGDADPFLDPYLYSLDGAPINVTVTNLPSGRYDLYFYGYGLIEVSSAGHDFTMPATTIVPSLNQANWMNGQQYIRFSDLIVLTEQPLHITVRRLFRVGLTGLPVIAGLQIAFKSANFVYINPSQGFFTNSVKVSIINSVSNAVTRYTLDATDPTASSLQYDDGLKLTSSSVLRAAAFVNGVRASAIAEARLTVVQIYLTIGTQPQSLTVKQGENASFTVEATGTPPLSYQWKFNGTDIAGATSKDLILTNVQPAEAGTYFVVVSDLGGSVTSLGAVLEVDDGRTGGTVAFGNRCTCDIDYPVFDEGFVRLSGPTFLAQLYAGTTAESLVPVGAAVPFRTGAAAGYWSTVTRVIPTIKPGDPVYVQVRVWASTNGPSYEAARAAFGKRGGSNVFLLFSGGVPDPITGLPGFPNPITRGLQGFKLRIGQAIAPKLGPTVRWDQNGLHLTLTGEMGVEYWIDASEDLNSWTPLANQWTWTGALEFIDADAASFSHRFYRARLVE